MNLYVMHDDPRGDMRADERHWEAVWADTTEQALAVYNAYHPDTSSLTLADVSVAEMNGKTAGPLHDEPHPETRPDQLRLIGWLVPGESTCSECGLAAMGLAEYRVCGGCYVCRECGCQCNDKEAPTP